MYDDEVQNLINRFLFSAKPNNGDSSAPATIGGINKLIEKVVELVHDISKLEK